MNKVNPDALDYEVYSSTNTIRAMTNQIRKWLNLPKKSYPLVLLEIPKTGKTYYMNGESTKPCPVCHGVPETPRSVNVGQTGYQPVLITCSHPCHDEDLPLSPFNQSPGQT